MSMYCPEPSSKRSCRVVEIAGPSSYLSRNRTAQKRRTDTRVRVQQTLPPLCVSCSHSVIHSTSEQVTVEHRCDRGHGKPCDNLANDYRLIVTHIHARRTQRSHFN